MALIVMNIAYPFVRVSQISGPILDDSGRRKRVGFRARLW
jgi:hypothetical protein